MQLLRLKYCFLLYGHYNQLFMKQRSSFQIALFAFLLLVVQSTLLIHASVHDLHDDTQAACKLCLAADHLNSALASDSFNFVVTPVTATDITTPYLSYIAFFKASSPLPRAPPFV
ncbi:MAG: hypothetical protein DSZ28_02900 [Thiothrix sp.]|nr:MAG: hypothetical protein DSZ28_02900 [Thiothrix sp.]